jgi:general secretion pathway protein C
MALDQVLKRHFWAVALVLVGVAAFLDASGITQIIGAGLGADDKQLATPPLLSKAPPGSGSASPHSTDAKAILDRNPFDSVTGPLHAPALVASDEPASLAPPPDLTDPWEAPPCEGVKVLIIAASTDPEWSFAAFSTSGSSASPSASPSAGEKGGEGGKTVLRRRGGDVEGKSVEFIGWDRVWLKSSGARCQAEMFKPGAPAPSASHAAPAPMPAASGGATAVPPEIAKGVVKVGPTEFNVDRGVVDKILENQAELMRQARIVPEQENGKLVGIRLFGVRPDTLLGVLGMENGDRLEKINGYEMTSPEKALEAYARLRTADHLTVSVNRRGSDMNLDYNIK